RANSRRPWPAAPVLRASNRSVAASKSSRSAIAAAMANLHPFAMLNQITSDSGTPSVSLAHRDLVLDMRPSFSCDMPFRSRKFRNFAPSIVMDDLRLGFDALIFTKSSWCADDTRTTLLGHQGDRVERTTTDVDTTRQPAGCPSIAHSL